MNVLKPHVSLNVADVGAAVAFYEKAFGVPASKRRPGYAKFDLTEPALNLTMQQAPRTGVNASHFGVQVASREDVAAARARFERAGLVTRTEDDVECCYALQDKVWIEDPDGNAWEVFAVKGESASMAPRPAPRSGASGEAPADDGPRGDAPTSDVSIDAATGACATPSACCVPGIGGPGGEGARVGDC